MPFCFFKPVYILSTRMLQPWVNCQVEYIVCTLQVWAAYIIVPSVLAYRSTLTVATVCTPRELPSVVTWDVLVTALEQLNTFA